MMLRGYIDESFDRKQDLFTLACLISTGKEWAELERAWKTYLGGWNKRLKKLGRPPLTRYHASDCRNLKREFEGWSTDEQRELTQGPQSADSRESLILSRAPRRPPPINLGRDFLSPPDRIDALIVAGAVFPPSYCANGDKLHPEDFKGTR